MAEYTCTACGEEDLTDVIYHNDDGELIKCSTCGFTFFVRGDMTIRRSGYWAFDIGMKPILDSTSTIEEVEHRLAHLADNGHRFISPMIFRQTYTTDREGNIGSMTFDLVPRKV